VKEQGDATKSGSRRKFLRNAGMAAGGVALIGATGRASGQAPGSESARPVRRDAAVIRASAQSPDLEQGPAGGSQPPTPTTNPPPAPAGGPQGPVRASAPAEKHLKHLGPLHNLSGTWMGTGFNLIPLPDFAELKVSTSGGGGILNIPFVVANAKVTQFDATFWIEKVLQPDGVNHFMQLQYTQRLVLFFKEISWPHISIATLVKQ